MQLIRTFFVPSIKLPMSESTREICSSKHHVSEGVWFPSLITLIAPHDFLESRGRWIISADSQLLPAEEVRGGGNWEFIAAAAAAAAVL